MALAQESRDPPSALWSDPGVAGGPGTFAVVIGVSEYRHLEGGPGPLASNPHGLGQLAVSALTAYRVFQWLGHAYDFEEAPLSRCWLLTSPTPAELAVEPGLAGTPAATLKACRIAITQWHAALQALHPDHIEKSRVLFFFSGHGIEKSRDRQILLCCDYLEPPLDAVDDALSTRNIVAGMLDLPVSTDLLFVDACRSVPDTMKGLEIDGLRVLNEPSDPAPQPERVSPIVYASGSGAEAWQPASVDDGGNGDGDGRLSLFGEALLAGLNTVACDPACGHPGPHVRLNPLTDFLNQQIARRLRDAGTSVRFPIKVGGEAANVCLTGRPAVAARGAAPPAARRGVEAPPPPAPAPAPDALEPVVSDRRSVGRAVPAGADASGSLHDLLGHEYLTWAWASARVRRLGRGDTDSSPRPVLHHVEVLDGHLLRVSFSLEPGSWWLELPLPRGSVLATAVQGEAWSEVRYTAEFSEESPERGLMVGLDEENEGWPGAAARMWEQYARVRMDRALDVLDATELERMLREKLESPLSATVAGLILLRGRRWERLHDWLGNLANWFPEHPDGLVLWAEQRRQTEGWRPEVAREVAERIGGLEAVGLPRMGETHAYALRTVEELLRVEAVTSTAELSDPLRRLEARLRLTARYLDPTGLFTSYVVPETEPADTRVAELAAAVGVRVEADETDGVGQGALAGPA